ncbi:thioesterase family protein [Saccharopolyspora flava]|uniref:Thioesterase-like superfamily protein n=1 Tax=Saccharopolyspora flava TaxID=95161 RepID=A0A1I6SEK7_9PSEU|nr:thioesterase family protein [Saccharopolyspora flava]SFS75416.1 Thioesterase-like superfamily protein [Saccharopolyspora flava]
MRSFAEATALSELRAGVHTAALDSEWSIGKNPHGGYMMALLTKAALRTAQRSHPLAVSAHFLRSPDAGEVELHTERVKRGRLFSTAHARLVQNGKVCIEATVTAGEISDAAHQWEAAQQPPIKPIDECPDHRMPTDGGLLGHLNLRLDPHSTAFLRGETDDGEVRGWMELTDGTDFDPLTLIVAVDMLPPTVFGLGQSGWCPTVELTYQLRALPAPGPVAGYTRCDALSADGWFNEDAAVYDSRGRLVAQSRQLALSGTALKNR